MSFISVALNVDAPAWVSPLRLFLLGVAIEHSPPPPVGAVADQIPGDADDRGKSQDRDEGNGSPGRVVRREEPESGDEPED
jgi:hypothetical protein